MVSERGMYFLDEYGRFIIENYNWAKPISNFLPGIAGKWGIPMWVYYVSKNQGICSFGIQSKDQAIMEFQSFNKACQSVSTVGFRTFIKFQEGDIYEAFKKTENNAITQRLIISTHELELEEINQDLGVKTNVLYYSLVNLPVPGLVRRVTIENLLDKKQNIEVLDGAPRVIPYGVTFEHLKVISRHIEGMMGVTDLDGVSIYKLKQTADDIEEIGSLDSGNFYCALSDDGLRLNENTIVDPKLIFGEIEQLDFPWIFSKNNAESLMAIPQIKENRTPCAMSLIKKSLGVGENVKCDSVFGQAGSQDKLRDFLDEFKEKDFLNKKREENKEIIEKLKQGSFTISAEPAFDQYCQQNYLDNVMRGGTPLSLESEGSHSIFYIYGRQGGDLERDYHWFILEPSYLSQGNGHYRNMLQNRRMDNWLNPEIGDHNIQAFLNLIQLDGYNPLVVEGVRYIGSNHEKIKDILQRVTKDQECLDLLLAFTRKAFTPGDFLMELEKSVGEMDRPYEEILAELLPCCVKSEIGALHEGYWIDHWFYNLDLIEAFLAIFPDRLWDLLIGNETYSFFDNPDVVQPRSKKTVLANGKVRQYQAVFRDPEKEALIASRSEYASKMRTRKGHGDVYRTNLLVKLLCLLTNKTSSLDPFGFGIEMEAGKPGWCDSLNGLPGLFGSSICETLELIRFCRMLLACLNDLKLSPSETQPIFTELYEFIGEVTRAIKKSPDSINPDKEKTFWQETHAAKEDYLKKTKFGISGTEESVSFVEIIDFITDCLKFLETKFTDRSKGKLLLNGVPYTYFVNQVSAYELLTDGEKDNKIRYIKPKTFQQTPVALFLEGPTHYIRLYPEDAEAVYNSVLKSGIYDKKLNTFKVCSSLEKESYELGRIKAYSAGWIENESIYTHMQFKWLLELLRAGLYEQFFQEMKTAFPPFLDPQQYGRSILENCSFIASSAHPDLSIHGQGFQPRFSGVTAEFINIWLLMTAGKIPFFMNNNQQLQFHLQPILPAWLFTKEETVHDYWKENTGWEEVAIPAKCFAFKLLGKTLVIYHNPKQRPTFGQDAVHVRRYSIEYDNGENLEIQGTIIGEPTSKAIRDKKINRIEILLD